MLGKNFIFVLIIIFILGLAFLWMTNNLPKRISEEKEEFIPSNRAATFTIGGGKGFPTFAKELVVDPIEPKKGEKQIFSIWVKDPKGIEKVTAVIKTDAKDELIEFKLMEGTEIEGRWQGSWITRDISPNSRYRTVFQAINKEGEEAISPFPWQSAIEF